MSEVKVNKISPRSGTDVQLGDSGDTITVPSGATLDTSNSSVTLPDGSVTSAKISYPLTTFSSTGIDDNATSTAITIDSSERVGIGTSSPNAALEVTSGDTDAIDIMSNGAIELSDAGSPSRAYTYLSRNQGDSMVGGNMRFDTSVVAGTHIGYAKGTNFRGGSGIIFDNPTSGYGYISFVQNNDTGDDTWDVVERMRLDSSGNLKFNSGYGSVATAYGCRAWVNFNGQGTVAIRESGNISSITDTGVGRYTVNFSTAMPDGNYSATAVSFSYSTTTREQTSTYLNVQIRTTSAAAYDPEYVNVAIHR